MDDRLLKFIRLIEAGSYTNAAKELHVSQPALTVAIQKLEKELGADLVVRSGKRLELTPAGRAVYLSAQKHQEISRELIDTLHKIKRKRPVVTVGMIDGIADQLCATEAFSELEKHTDVTLVVNNSRYLREQVEQHTVSCALIIDDELEHQGTTAMPFADERLRLVCRPELLDQLAEGMNRGVIGNFISYDKPSTTYRHIRHHLSNQGVRTKTRLYSTSPSVMLNMVLEGKGCAVLPEHMCQPLLESGTLATLLDPLVRPISLITNTSTKLPTYVDEFFAESRRILIEAC